MRERGLKYFRRFRELKSPGSLPMRERGLKLAIRSVTPNIVMSLPMRERGLKYDVSNETLLSSLVAPHAGAWIEIHRIHRTKHQK